MVSTSPSFEKRGREKAVKLEQSDSFYTEDFAKKEHNENVLYCKSAAKNTPQNNKYSYQKRNFKRLQIPLDGDVTVDVESVTQNFIGQADAQQIQFLPT